MDFNGQLLVATAILVSILALHSPNVQAMRIARDVLEVNNVPHDFGKILLDYKNENNTRNWRVEGTNIASPNFGYMLNSSMMTDCVFVVGQDGQEQDIAAHCVILAAASPIFEAATKKKSLLFRIKDWQPKEFQKILRFIYYEELCFADFDEACAMLKYASDLEMESLKDLAREFILALVPQEKHWEALHCARKAADQKLLDLVFQFISEHASVALREKKFEEIHEENLVNLLERDDLHVTSEKDVYDAVVRWGHARVKEAGLSVSLESMRHAISPAILKNIRFLTMTQTEMSKLSLDEVLNYEEIVPVVKYNTRHFDLKNLPETLSPSTTKRKFKNSTKTAKSTFKVVLDCNHVNVNYFQTIADIPFNSSVEIAGVQIPKSLEARNDNSLKEHIGVLILDWQDKIVWKVVYNQVPPQKNLRFVYNNPEDIKPIKDDSNSLNDDTLILVAFDPFVRLPAPRSASQRYKVKIVFHEKREYPTFVNAGAAIANTYFGASTTTLPKPGCTTYHTLHNSPFVYSIITSCS